MDLLGINQAWQSVVWPGCLVLLGVEGLTANRRSEKPGFAGIVASGAAVLTHPPSGPHRCGVLVTVGVCLQSPLASPTIGLLASSSPTQD